MTPKQQLRRELKQRRAAISMIERAELSARISEKALSLPEYAESDTVLCYCSVRDEVITWPLLRHILDSGRVLALPAIEGSRMAVRRVTDLDGLVPGKMGILEPKSGPEVFPESIGLALVPGLGFDLTGGRIGYGGGYFDRYLALVPGLKAGLCFSAQITEELPREPHDVPMDALITENQIYRFGRKL